MIKEKSEQMETISSPFLPMDSFQIPFTQHKNVEEESKITSITGLRLNYIKMTFWIILCIITGGIMFLLSWWFLKLRMKMCFTFCSAQEATHLYITTVYHQEVVEVKQISTPSRGSIKTFRHHFLPYYLNGATFDPIIFKSDFMYKELYDEYANGINSKDICQERRILFGECQILVPVMGVIAIIVTELLHPFYMFQLFSIALWMWDGYRYYASAIILITVVSLTTQLIETRRNMKNIHKMAKFESKVKIYRYGKGKDISSTKLVPGDLIKIDNGKMPCDAVIVSGGCIVDEAMLTGESVPVIKDPIPYINTHKYDIDHDKRHSLYEGTHVIQTRNYGENEVLAIVVRTGFSTMKGKLVRTILYPKPNQFKFYQDSLKFIAVLAMFSLIGYAITLPFQIVAGMEPEVLVDRSLDLITVTVPPSLPAAMTAGTLFAISRLKKNHRVFCISPPRINVAGKIGAITFDKTGTLTEDGMDLNGVQGVMERQFTDVVPDPNSLIKLCKHFIEGMATCHSLTIINGELLGDTQDIRLFKSTGWLFEEPEVGVYDPIVKSIVKPPGSTPPNAEIFDGEGNIISMLEVPYEIGIVHTFHFNSKAKRMGVIVKDLQSSNFAFYLKGAPEVVLERCNPNSLPPNVIQLLQKYTTQGYRVLAYASKTLPKLHYNEIRALELESVETDLNFLGLAILQNRLKKETIPSIEKLQNANIRTIMATGDAALTGVSVAKECGIIKPGFDVYLGELMNGEVVWEMYPAAGGRRISDVHIDPGHIPWLDLQISDTYVIAMSGTAFMHMVQKAEAGIDYDKAVLKIIIEKGQVFARMAPEHKAVLVEHMQESGILVAMCGDGANDCGALKVADIGISLSEAEASIAAPFTSAVPNISCVTKVLAEGRCALATSIQCFKFMALYSTIQFCTVCTLYVFSIDLSDMQFLIIDLFTILPIGIAMCYTGPLDYLSKRELSGTLMSAGVLSSVIGQSILQIIVQLGTLLFTTQMDFYETNEVHTDDLSSDEPSYQNTVLFLVSNFQYLVTALVFSIGKPWKKPAYTNMYLNVVTFFLMSFAIYLIIIPAEGVRDFAGIKDLPMYFRGYLVAICACYALFAYLYERFFVSWMDINEKRRFNKKHYKNKVVDFDLALRK